VSERGLEPLRPCGHQPLKPPGTVYAVRPSRVLPGHQPDVVHAVRTRKSRSVPLFSRCLAETSSRMDRHAGSGIRPAEQALATCNTRCSCELSYSKLPELRERILSLSTRSVKGGRGQP